MNVLFHLLVAGIALSSVIFIWGYRNGEQEQSYLLKTYGGRIRTTLFGKVLTFDELAETLSIVSKAEKYELRSTLSLLIKLKQVREEPGGYTYANRKT